MNDLLSDLGAFWMGTDSDWAFYRIWAFITNMKKKNGKKCQTSIFFSNITKFFPKFLAQLIAKFFLILLLKLALFLTGHIYGPGRL